MGNKGKFINERTGSITQIADNESIYVVIERESDCFEVTTNPPGGFHRDLCLWHKPPGGSLRLEVVRWLKLFLGTRTSAEQNGFICVRPRLSVFLELAAIYAINMAVGGCSCASVGVGVFG
jgi:hypothetical protein